jgi:hypothetical protein
LIAVENIPKLNENALVAVGMTEEESLVAKDRMDRGLTP